MAEPAETISPGCVVPRPLMSASVQLDCIDHSVGSVQNGVSYT